MKPTAHIYQTKLKIISRLVIIFFFCLPITLAAEENISSECKTIKVAYKQFDIKTMIDFDRTASPQQRQACKTLFRYPSYEKDVDFFTCETLTEALYRSKHDSPAILEQFKRQATAITYQRCIRHALNRSWGQLEYKLFYKLVEELIAMNLPNQQALLDELLATYVVNDKQALEHKYVQALLAFGSNPATTQYDTPILSRAFWHTYVGGGTCKTARLIIDALSPEDLAIPYNNRAGNHPEKNIDATTLMDVSSLSTLCPEEGQLVVEKAAEINKQDKNGNTALHHFYLDVIAQKNLLIPHKVDFINILRKRGASFDIPNKDNMTAEQLRLQLKQDKKRCRDLCSRL